MTWITLHEITDLIIMTLVLGYMFMDQVRRPRSRFEILHPKKFDGEAFKFATLIIAPGIVLHELGHKFVAMAFGLAATFKMWIFGLILGFAMKLLHSPIVLIAPGYVEIQGGTYVQQALIAFAGPAVNLLLWGIAAWILKNKQKMSHKEFAVWTVLKQINMFLFVFNMLPVPPLDGSKVFYNLWKVFF